MDAHETHEKIHEAAHGGHGHHQPGRRATALLISVLAAALALAEMGANSSQTAAVAANIEASNLWAFFQAKTVRKTTLLTAAEAVGLLPGAEAGKLAERARAAGVRHDRAMAAFHLFEYGAGALQIGIVLASAAVVTGVGALAWAAGGLGLLGSALAVLALAAPMAVHF